MRRELPIIATLFLSLLQFSLAQDNIKITYNYIRLAGILWTNQTTALMLADNGVYRSVDEGQNWAFVNGSGATYDFYQDNSDKNKVLLLRPGSNNLVTLDGGITFLQGEQTGNLPRLDIHEQLSGWLLGVTNERRVLMSRDMGQTWDYIFTGATNVAWYTNDSGNLPAGSFFAIDNYKHFNVSTDGGATFTTLFNTAVGFIKTDDYLYVGLLDEEDDDLMLKICTNDANSADPNSYRLAEFPFGDEVSQNSFSILDDDAGAIWIGVNTGANTWGGLYTSGPLGYQYVLALPHTANLGGLYDLTSVGGLNGIHLANNVTNWEADRRNNADLRTHITFDNGGEWRTLQAPSFDSTGQPISCTGACSLHLNGLTTYFLSAGSATFFYSTENAIGLILATGNIGTSLAKIGSQYNTYMSRDAGLTWVELLQGPYVYEFGDHGGIIIGARTDQATNVVMYSLDEGKTINYKTFSSKSVYVDNILSEPSATGRKFILYGTEATGTKHVVIGIDFSGVYEATCTEDDYEEWSPYDGRANQQQCLLGQNVVYSRKKQTAQCFNDRQTEHLLSQSICECTYEDWECDFGYQSTFNNIPGTQEVCALSGPIAADPPANCPSGTTYYVSRGYRKVPGDVCTGGLDLSPIAKQCPTDPNTQPSGSKKWIAVVVVVVVLVVAFVGIGIFIYNNDELKEKISGWFGRSSQSQYSRLNAGGSLVGDSEFGIAENDLSDDEEDAQVLHDNDIASKADDFNPRS
eukprot:TRINITY_DN2346_c0_g1_i2.p1 TRINITY_DN2346_c0_g1~~TRINITY_DN2346_c0_g1_i2.p1  ORF type:complete len:747 (-),score=203.44 TRINITY_DN2346_c0_g1_i2:58-2298(-)